MQPIPFTYEAYQSRSKNVDFKRCINMYPEMDQGNGGKTVKALYGRPGLLLNCALDGSGPIRGNGLYTVPIGSGRSFAVRGNTLFEFFADGTFINRGTIKTNVGPVFMADNGIMSEAGFGQLALSDGQFLYIFNLETNDPIAWIEFYSDNETPLLIDTITFQDQYFIGNIPGTRKFAISGIGDGTSWNVLDFDVKSSISDPIICVKSNGQNLWLFGSKSLETWYDSGNVNFPFAERIGTEQLIGCASKASVVCLKNQMFWIGDGEQGRGIVWTSDGYQPTRVSNYAIEFFLSEQEHLEDAVAWSYEKGGHFFYCLSLQISNKTLCYDLTEGVWHERAYLDPNTGELGRDRAIGACFLNGKTFVGDYANGNLYELSEDTYTDNGQWIKALINGPHISSDDKRIQLSNLQLLCEGGTGTNDGQGKDPKVFLRLSRDYGHTYGTLLEATIGKIGQYANRSIWRNLGLARDFVPEFTMTDPVKRVFIGMQADIVVGKD